MKLFMKIINEKQYKNFYYIISMILSYSNIII